MDRVHEFLKGEIEFHNHGTLDKMLAWYAAWAGSSWIPPLNPPYDTYRDVDSSELEVRSALEFIRSELTPPQLKSLAEWDGLYCKWRDEGIFFKRYRDAQGGRFTWEDERAFGEEELGRKIPKSHWWYWPPDENKD
ncbi:MAG: hypothetical protein Q4F74_04205 [Synergistaceae bacterium]|nr:hypothetical protein [Synergistaceae bacterium]